MIRKIGKLAAAATLAMSLGVAGGGSLMGGVTHVHAAPPNNAGVSQFCQAIGRDTIANLVLGIDIPVSQGACVSTVESVLLNQQGLGSSAIAASLCQTLAPTDQGACVSSFNAFFKAGGP
jgi:hypothetical protein